MCPEPLTHSVADHGATTAPTPTDGAERTLGATAGLCAVMPYNCNCNCTTTGDKKFWLPKRCYAAFGVVGGIVVSTVGPCVLRSAAALVRAKRLGRHARWTPRPRTPPNTVFITNNTHCKHVVPPKVVFCPSHSIEGEGGGTGPYTQPAIRML
jgi:hypothetical protein